MPTFRDWVVRLRSCPVQGLCGASAFFFFLFCVHQACIGVPHKHNHIPRATRAHTLLNQRFSAGKRTIPCIAAVSSLATVMAAPRTAQPSGAAVSGLRSRKETMAHPHCADANGGAAASNGPPRLTERRRSVMRRPSRVSTYQVRCRWAAPQRVYYCLRFVAGEWRRRAPEATSPPNTFIRSPTVAVCGPHPLIRPLGGQVQKRRASTVVTKEAMSELQRQQAREIRERRDSLDSRHNYIIERCGHRRVIAAALCAFRLRRARAVAI